MKEDLLDHKTLIPGPPEFRRAEFYSSPWACPLISPVVGESTIILVRRAWFEWAMAVLPFCCTVPVLPRQLKTTFSLL